MIVSTVFAFIVAGGCYFLGGFGRLFVEDVSAGFDTIIPTMLEKSLPAILIALVLVLVVSASMSTLSSLVMSSSSTITLDLIKSARKNGLTPRSQMILIRFFVALFIVISAVIAIVYDELKLSFIAQMMGVSWGALAGAFLAPYLFSLYWKKTTKASCWVCFVFGVATSIVALVLSLSAASLPQAVTDSFLYKYVFSSSIYVGTWTMLAGFIIVPVVSLFTKKPAQERLQKLFKPFAQLNDAVETAVEDYLVKPHVSTAQRPQDSEDEKK